MMKLLTKKGSLLLACTAVYCVGSVADLDAAKASSEEAAAPDSLTAMFTQAKIEATINGIYPRLFDFQQIYRNQGNTQRIDPAQKPKQSSLI